MRAALWRPARVASLAQAVHDGAVSPGHPIALTIAGSDPSGGAGVQADLKTFHQHGVYGTGVITLLTVQNTLGVQRVELVAPDLVDAQIGALATDVAPHAIKTGALGSAAIIEAVAAQLLALDAPLVIDPVGLSKNRHALVEQAARETLLTRLLPRATLITPNLDELAWLSGRAIESEADMIDAGRALADVGARAVLVKGGHRDGEPIDLLLVGAETHRLAATRVPTRHTHGVGCALSAAITARISAARVGADGGRIEYPSARLLADVTAAKGWLTRAIAQAPGLGAGHGPIDHFAKISS